MFRLYDFIRCQSYELNPDIVLIMLRRFDDSYQRFFTCLSMNVDEEITMRDKAGVPVYHIKRIKPVLN